jgi:hypothetical protein
MVNPAGALFSGRVMDLAPDQITKGAATVLVGGPQFQYEVKRLADGRVQVGNNIFINADPARPNFQSETLAAMGVMSTTPSGQALLSSIDGAKNSVDISYYNEMNGSTSYADPGATTDPTRGSNASVKWNPDYQSNNPLDPSNPSSADSTLFHEMNHANHGVNGVRDPTRTGDAWDTNEERNTINDRYPSENDYLNDRGYPYARSDHRDTNVPMDQRPPPGSHAPEP